MSARSELDKAILHAVHADRQNSRKWHPLYTAFDDELDVDIGVAGKLLTEEKQLSNRLEKELIRENPRYIVLCYLDEVRLEKVREHLAEANLPAARFALIVKFNDSANRLEPAELQVYHHDDVVEKVTALYPE